MKSFLRKMIIPTAIMVWATIFLLEVLQYPKKNYILIKPVYFVLLAFYIVNGVLDYISFKRSGSEEHVVDEQQGSLREKAQLAVKSENFKIFLVFFALLAAGLLLNSIGFFIILPLFLLSILFIAGIKNWKPLVIIPIALTIVLYLIFEIGLGVALPYGIFA